MTTEKTVEEASSKRTGNAKDVGAVVNAIQILRHLANAEGPEGATAIARATGISPSTTFNILRTLSNEQLTSFDNAPPRPLAEIDAELRELEEQIQKLLGEVTG